MTSQQKFARQYLRQPKPAPQPSPSAELLTQNEKAHAYDALAARAAELEAALRVCAAYYDGSGRTSDRDVKEAIARVALEVKP